VLLPVAQVAIRWAPPQPYVELPHFLIAFKAIVHHEQSETAVINLIVPVRAVVTGQ
jgi:hypothetical protein